jgi:hypothetical protein
MSWADRAGVALGVGILLLCGHGIFSAIAEPQLEPDQPSSPKPAVTTYRTPTPTRYPYGDPPCGALGCGEVDPGYREGREDAGEEARECYEQFESDGDSDALQACLDEIG